MAAKYDAEKLAVILFPPETFDPKVYLAAFHWECLENGLWSHPGHDAETGSLYETQGGYTTEQAVVETKEFYDYFIQGANEHPKQESRAWNADSLYEIACRYAYYVAYPELWETDVSLPDLMDWAKEHVPAPDQWPTLATDEPELSPRAKHLAWCKKRALKHLETGDTPNAIACFISNLGKQEETAAMRGSEVFRRLWEDLIWRNNSSKPDEVRRWIEGFN